MGDQLVGKLLEYGLAGVVIIGLVVALVHEYKRACREAEEKFEIALRSQGILKDATDAFKLVLQTLRNKVSGGSG